MSSELKMTLRPESIRTLFPVTVEVSAADVPSLTVDCGGEGFRVPVRARAGGFEGAFWLASPGDCRVTASAAGETVSRDFRVSEQAFLSFPVEFGAFSLALLLAGGGLILWFRSRKRAGSSSASSPS